MSNQNMKLDLSSATWYSVFTTKAGFEALCKGAGIPVTGIISGVSVRIVPPTRT